MHRRASALKGLDSFPQSESSGAGGEESEDPSAPAGRPSLQRGHQEARGLDEGSPRETALVECASRRADARGEGGGRDEPPRHFRLASPDSEWHSGIDMPQESTALRALVQCMYCAPSSLGGVHPERSKNTFVWKMIEYEEDETVRRKDKPNPLPSFVIMAC